MTDSLDLLRDCSERVPYNLADFPVYAHRARSSHGRELCVASHWHDDLECGIVLSGRVTYTINGAPLRLHKGEGIFINARQLHGHISAEGSDFEYLCVLVHPSLLSASRHVEETCVTPLITNEAFPYAVLRSETPWQASFMATMRGIEDAFAVGEQPSLLTIQSLSFQAASLLSAHMPEPKPLSAHIDRRIAALRNMVGFVQLHYQEPLSLADIAAAGNVSKSTCCTLFQQQLGQTPMGYVTRYRLEKGAVLLEQPDLPVIDVAMAVGFSSASYFAETFRKTLGLTPSEYRKRRL